MSSRLKLNYFTPLPPLETAIANFSVSVLHELNKLADVRVWTSQDTWDEDIDQVFDIRRFNPEALNIREFNWADVNFYNLGNNAECHRSIFDVARLVPGVIILHDTHLPHFFFSYAAATGQDLDYYLSALGDAHGQDASAQAQQALGGVSEAIKLVFSYPMTKAALNAGMASITHNQREYASLVNQTNQPVYYLPLAFDYSPLSSRLARPSRRRTRLIMFGYLGSNRRLIEVLTAIATHPDRQNFVLDLYGRISELKEIEKKIEQLKLDRIVRLHGFVSESDLNAALARADLAINLRFPTMGEASSSQLQIWAAGLPSIVTRIGWYASLPQDSVFFVEPDTEIEDIQSHLTALRRHPSRFRAAGLSGRAQLEKYHHPRGYAEGLIRIAQDAPIQHASMGARQLAHSSAELLKAMFGAELAFTITPAVADAIHQITTPPAPK